jgi:RNA polymerase sigma factor (sigma-70 family)
MKAELITVAYGRLRLIARRMLASYDRDRLDEETDGLIAESYLRLNRAIDELKPEDARQFFALAALQMRRHLLDKLRRLQGRGQIKRPHQISLDAPAENEDQGPLEVAGNKPQEPWTSLDILQAMEQLDDRDRECLTLQTWYGFTHAEIGELLKVSTKTVQRSCNAAYIRLNEILKSYENQSDRQ